MINERTSLREYLADALAVETAVDELEDELLAHDRSANGSKPVFKPLPEPELYASRPEPLEWYVPLLCIGPLAIVLLFLIWTVFIEPVSIRSVVYGLGMLLTLALIFVIPNGIAWIRHVRAASRYSRQCAQYELELEKIQTENNRLAIVYKAELQAWETTFGQARASIEAGLAEARERRRAFYETDGRLYEKYRSSTCIEILLRYFISGRRSELTGPNGAYDLLEEELFRTDLTTTLHQFQSDASGKLAALYELCYAAATSERIVHTTTTFTIST